MTALGRPGPPAESGWRWVYLWGVPLRVMHWIAALAIVALVVTGLYIGRPFFTGGAEPGLLMTRVRFIHYLAAVFLVTTAIVRAYWLLAGNRFERLAALFPVRRRDWVNLFGMVKHYLMIGRREGPNYLGHNPLQQLSYTGVYALALLEVVTGVTLYSQASPLGLWYKLTFWVVPLAGSLQTVRLIHHAVTWIFIPFVVIHVYLSIRADNYGLPGTVSGIVSGGRFFREGVEYEDE